MALSRCLAILCALFVLSAVTPGVEAAEVNQRMVEGSGTPPAAAADGEYRVAHCCHSHPRPPYDRYCCHSGAYVAPARRAYRGSVRRSSRRTARRVSRRRR